MAESCTQGTCPNGGICMNDKCIRSTMVTAGVQCQSDHESLGKSLGTFDSFYECEQACIDKEGCKYFLYGQPGTGNAKNCYWEKTESASCPEGFEEDTYNFHSLDLSDGVGMVTFDQVGQPGSRQEPSLRTMRDVVDFGFTRGCLEGSFRGSSSTSHGNASDKNVCSMNLYQDFYGGEDLQMKSGGLLANEMLGNNPGDADWNRLKKEPSWRNYPSGHIGAMWTFSGENVEEAKFHRNSNIARRAGTVAHPKSEYFLAGCIGQPQAGEDDGFDWFGKLRPLASSNEPAGPDGFVDYTDQKTDDVKTTACTGITDKDTCDATPGCLSNTTGGMAWNSRSSCISGLTSGQDKHTFGNVKIEGEAKASNEGGSTGIAQTSEPYFSDSSKYCKRNTETQGEKFSRQYVRRDSNVPTAVYDESSTSTDKHAYPTQAGGSDTDSSLHNENIERACCLGAGTYMQGQKEKGQGYKAFAGKTSAGRPLYRRRRLLGRPARAARCSATQRTRSFSSGRQTRQTRTTGRTGAPVRSSREKSEPWPSDREGPKLDAFVWPASNTCRRRCGVAGKENSRNENLKDEYGASWIGSAFGDSYNINEQRVRSGVGWGIGAGAAPFRTARLGCRHRRGRRDRGGQRRPQGLHRQGGQGISETQFGQHLRVRVPAALEGQRRGAAVPLTRCGSAADKHDDSADGFVCDFDNRECEKITAEAKCAGRRIGPGKAKCYWRNGKCSSFTYEYKNCGDAFCYGDEHGSTFMCVKNCGWKKGLRKSQGGNVDGRRQLPVRRRRLS